MAECYALLYVSKTCKMLLIADPREWLTGTWQADFDEISYGTASLSSASHVTHWVMRTDRSSNYMLNNRYAAAAAAAVELCRAVINVYLLSTSLRRLIHSAQQRWTFNRFRHVNKIPVNLQYDKIPAPIRRYRPNDNIFSAVDKLGFGNSSRCEGSN